MTLVYIILVVVGALAVVGLAWAAGWAFQLGRLWKIRARVRELLDQLRRSRR